MTTEVFWNKEISLWWPEWDTKPKQNYAYILKHLADMDLAIAHCKQNRVCVQAGGHVGLWPMRLSQHFFNVYTFEAEKSVYQCMEKNVSAYPNIYPKWAALSEMHGEVLNYQRSGSSGSTRIKSHGDTVISATIDSLDLDCCDVIFLDVEHHELQALKGAVETIKNFSPIIQVEELEHDDGVKEFLQTLGYKKIAKESKDAVYVKG